MGTSAPDGDDDFERWYVGLHPRLHATLRAACGSADEADEAVAEAFSRAYERWPQVRAMENRDGWTFRVGLNHARRRARRRSRDAAVVERPPGSVDDADGTWQAAVDTAIAGLPRRMREVVVLRYVADLTEPAIAEVLHVSRGTVSSTLRDARARLAHLVDDTDDTNETDDRHAEPEDVTP